MDSKQIHDQAISELQQEHFNNEVVKLKEKIITRKNQTFLQRIFNFIPFTIVRKIK